MDGCHEIAKWAVFKKLIEISQEQLNLVRTATHRPKENAKGIEPIGDNYRKTKSVKARSVLEVDILDNQAWCSEGLSNNEVKGCSLLKNFA